MAEKLTSYGSLQLLEKFLARAASTDEIWRDSYTLFMGAIESGRFELAESLIEKGVDISAMTRSRDGKNVVRIAVDLKHSNIIDLLLDAGVEVSALPLVEDKLDSSISSLGTYKLPRRIEMLTDTGAQLSGKWMWRKG
jgi:ankyrin repeat protein